MRWLLSGSSHALSAAASLCPTPFRPQTQHSKLRQSFIDMGAGWIRAGRAGRRHGTEPRIIKRHLFQASAWLLPWRAAAADGCS